VATGENASAATGRQRAWVSRALRVLHWSVDRSSADADDLKEIFESNKI
jgi:hypothetical protein